MSSGQYEGRVPPEAVGLVARLHATLDVLLDADLSELPETVLPELVTGLVAAGQRLVAAQLDAVGALDARGLAAAWRHQTSASTNGSPPCPTATPPPSRPPPTDHHP